MWAQGILHESDEKLNIVLLFASKTAVEPINQQTSKQQTLLNINLDALYVRFGHKIGSEKRHRRRGRRDI